MGTNRSTITAIGGYVNVEIDAGGVRVKVDDADDLNSVISAWRRVRRTASRSKESESGGYGFSLERLPDPIGFSDLGAGEQPIMR